MCVTVAAEMSHSSSCQRAPMALTSSALIALDGRCKRRCTGRVEQTKSDAQKAHAMNFAEAKKAKALYVCDCCCGDVTFELMSTCSDGSHIICFNCLGRTMQEALYGQGWSRSIDPDRGSIRCLAPLIDSQCYD